MAVTSGDVQPHCDAMEAGTVTGAVAGTPAGDVGWHMSPSRTTVIGAVVRRLVPYLIEASLIPSAIFYLLLVTTELRWALVGALSWSYAAVLRRLATHRPVPGLLILATLGISVRTVIALLSGSTFVYFAQPILRTVLTAALFLGSVAVGRPLITRFAADFCPLTPDVQCRPGVLSLFKRLTYLWGAVNIVVAASSLVLLLTLPVSLFVVTTAVCAWIVTCSGVVITVGDSVRTARREGLITALSPNGTLYAATTHPMS
jgi:hypothetical protein